MRSPHRRIGRHSLIATAALALAAVAGCGGGSSSTGSAPAPGGTGFTPPKIEALKSLGQGEGQVNLVAWAGYAEDGSNDPKVDWVHPFETATGCKVNTKTAGTSDEMVNLMKTGEYDAVSASGDASLRLIASGTVAPVNTDLIPNYKDVFEGLKLKPWNSVNGVSYGVPHGRGANLLMWRTDKVTTPPDSWGVVFDPASPYKGHVTAYDSPIYIADAALYLMSAKPELGIKDPYALDDKQLQAAVDLLKQQKANIGEYWSDYTKAVQSFKSGDTVVGTTWQVIANLTEAEKAPVQVTLPKEGSTGWSDTWMVAAKAQHPNCAYKWMDWIISPKANAQVAEWFGEAPSNAKACDETSDKAFCDTYHADDESYFSKVHYWTTPIVQCLDGRTDVKCTDYSEWTRAWTEIKG
jgi:putative spermidine/putrescine transport system substrate-binding protein